MSYDAGLATTTHLHRGLVAEGQPLLHPTLSVFWTPHSPRSFVAACRAALGVAKAERNVLGRWAQNQSDTYVRLQRTLVQKLQLLVVSVIRGRADIGSVLAEGESLQGLDSFFEKRGVDREAVKKQLTRLAKTAAPGPGGPAVAVAGRSTGRRNGAVGPRKRLTWSFGQPAPSLRKHQGIPSPNVERASRRLPCLRGWPVQGKTLAQVGILLEGAQSGLLCVLVSCLGNTSTRKCACAAAQPCSYQCHRTVAQTRIRPRTSTEIRLSPFPRRPVVCPTPPTPLPRIHGSRPAGNRATHWWTEDCCQEVTETCSSDSRRRCGQHRNGSRNESQQ